MTCILGMKTEVYFAEAKLADNKISDSPILIVFAENVFTAF